MNTRSCPRHFQVDAVTATTTACVFAAALQLRAATDPFAEGVRLTPPLTPSEQRQKFLLPPGFEIQLVASEPEIAKPMNLAFDAKGQLWVSSSYEYPFPAPLDRPGRDSIKVLSNFDASGKARTIRTFAENLNIPIGLIPYGKGVIGWSIPNIWHFEDTNDDGQADRRTVLFGPLGWERDTHGNLASFRRGFDGWLYGTHGFNNSSTFKAPDGSTISVNSGNTWRIRPDGSRVEQHTWGQVNPFGLCFDSFGNMYSADCHSAPIYQLLRGGYYPSFGKPHDGLGFAPVLMEHSHGSTAISGIAVYEGGGWPEEFRGNILVGNVMTSRINRDRLAFTGSSPAAIEQPDLVRTEDPWFRPVDIQFGPDGALYIADFYNRIIGHYEVPLQHPGRDRERGRIWRLVYRGGNSASKPAGLQSLALRSGVRGLIAELGSEIPARRLIALNSLLDNHGNSAASALLRAWKRADSPIQSSHLVWALHRAGSLRIAELHQAAGADSELVRTHAMRILSEIKKWELDHRELGLRGLRDSSPNVRRAAADALAQQPSIDQAKPLLDALRATPAADNHLVHTLRMALRNQLRLPTALASFKSSQLDSNDARLVAEIALGIESSQAGTYLVDYLKTSPPSGELLESSLKHAARHASAESMDAIADSVQSRFAGQADQQLALFRAVRAGAAQRGAAITPAMNGWGQMLAETLLGNGASNGWRNEPIPASPRSANPWFVQPRRSTDGAAPAQFLCSLPPGGEALTGRLISPEFAAPAALTFYLAGHDGPPDAPPRKRNRIEIRSVATGKVLAEAQPPRNDLAQAASVDLRQHAGQRVTLEIVDADTGSAYAWLAAGRFDPAVPALPAISPREAAEQRRAGAELARELKLSQLAPALERMALDQNADGTARAAAASALAAFARREDLAALAPLLAEAELALAWRTRVAAAFAQGAQPQSAAASELLGEIMSVAPRRVQTAVALQLSGTPAGASILLDLASRGKAAPVLLVDPSIKARFEAALPAAERGKASELTKVISPAGTELNERVTQMARFTEAQAPDLASGEAIFKQNCAVCHRRAGEGGLIGPQLDGIRNRGIERLIEDIVDPNRNVDHAFRSQVLVLADGEVVTGLPRREEGGLLVVADSTGKELSIRQADIKSRRESELSLMPGNMAEILSPKQMSDLVGFLAQF